MPNPTPHQPTKPPEPNVLSGVTIAGKFMDWRILITKTISVVLLINGLKGLIEQVWLIFLVYPKLPDYYKALDFAPEIYQKIIISSVVLTTDALIEAIYGTMILIKQSHTVKRIHTIIGIIILAAAIIIGQLHLDLDTKEILQTTKQALLP